MIRKTLVEVMSGERKYVVGLKISFPSKRYYDIQLIEPNHLIEKLLKTIASTIKNESGVL